MATERIDIQITETGARVVNRNLKEMATNSKSAHDALELLKSALAALGIGLGLRELQQYVDAFTAVENRIKLVTHSTAELAAVENELFRNAQLTRTAIEPISQLYVRLGRAANDLGASQAQMLQFAKGVGEALALTGTSSQEASGALLQLAQAMGSGVVHAEEFNSVLEQAPAIAQAVAKGLTEMAQTAAGQEILRQTMDATSLAMVKMGLNVGRLKGLIVEGKVSSEAFFQAFLTQVPKLQSEFEKTTPTIGQAFTVLHNSFVRFIGDENKQLGVSALVSQSILGLAHAFDTQRKAVIAVAGALAVTFTPSLVSAITSAARAVLAFTAASLANPFIAAATAIAAAVAALSVYRDDIEITAEGHVTLGDYARGAWALVKQGVTDAIPVIEDWWHALLDKLPSLQTIGTFLMEVLLGALEFLKRWVNTWLGIWTGLVRSTIDAWNGFPAALKDIFTQAINGAIQLVEDGVNRMVRAINSVTSIVHIPPISEVMLGQMTNDVDGAAGKLAEVVKKDFSDALGTDFVQTALNGVTKVLEELKKKAQEAAAARQKAATAANDNAPAPVDLGAAPTGKFQLSASQLTSLKQLRDQLDPIQKATNAVSDGERLLGLALKANNLTVSQHANLVALLKARYRDTIDPLGALNREMDRQSGLLNIDKEHREAADKAYEYSLQLQKDGIFLSEQQRATLANNILLLNRQAETTDKYDQALEQANGPLRDFTQRQEALNRALLDGSISSAQFGKQFRDARIDFLDTQTDFGSGVERGLLKLQRSFNDFGSQAEQVVTGAFSSMESAVDQFAQTGKLKVDNLVTGILTDFAKLALRQAVEKPLLESFMAVLPSVLHTGGMVGANDNVKRAVPASAFATAPRYHSGLLGDEMPAILKLGEVVLNQPQQQAVAAAVGNNELTVNLYDQTGSGINAKVTSSRNGRGGRQLDIVIQEAVAKGIRTPGSPVNAALQQTFGAQQRVVGR